MKRSIIFASAMALALSGQLSARSVNAGDDQPVVVTGQPEEAVATRRVSFADLDLALASGQKTLHRRVSGAVRSVCLEATGPNPIEWAESACRTDVWRDARPQMARAVQRARDMALNGTSAIAPVAISISVASR